MGASWPTTVDEAVGQPYESAIREARSKLARIRQDGGPPGLSVALSVAGELVWSEDLGFADLENQVPMNGKTKMGVGSVAKSITAVALAELVEQDKLDGDAEIQTYLPEFPRKRWPITVRQVANHIAGLSTTRVPSS